MSSERLGILIRRTTVHEIRPLRHAVLRAGLPIAAAVFDGDDVPDTCHIGAFLTDGQNVGCASIVREAMNGEGGWRLRGMAVREDMQSSGVGRRLLEELEQIVGSQCDSVLLWCNARTPAVPFYRRAGWTAMGDEFDIPTAGPHFRMFKRLDK